MPTNRELLDYAVEHFRLDKIVGGVRTFDSCLVEALYIYTGDERFKPSDYQERVNKNQRQDSDSARQATGFALAFAALGNAGLAGSPGQPQEPQSD